MDKTAVKAIKLFLKKLKKDFLVNRVIFFGSRVREDYFEHSDIDLIIVSRDFEGIDFTKRMSLMYNYWNADYAVDFLCYTPEEFEKFSKMITVVREALNKGVLIS